MAILIVSEFDVTAELQAFAKSSQTRVVVGCIIPENCVSRIFDHMQFGFRDRRFVLFRCYGFYNSILGAVGDQDWFLQFRQ